VSERLLDAKAIGAMLGVSERWVAAAAREGRMPHVKLGRYVRFDEADVRAWLEGCKVSGRPVALRRGPGGV
jgi:excisionase family DNA binding protein